MRGTVAKRLRKEAKTLADVSGTDWKKLYKEAKKVHKGK